MNCSVFLIAVSIQYRRPPPLNGVFPMSVMRVMTGEETSRSLVIHFPIPTIRFPLNAAMLQLEGEWFHPIVIRPLHLNSRIAPDSHGDPVELIEPPCF